MLQVKNLNKSFGSKQVLFDINFKADNGKILGLIGKNGSGKTTLFHSILKFVKYQGEITIDNRSFSSRDYNSVGYLPEERSLMPKLTVLDQVSFLAILKGMKKDTVKHDLQDWMQKLEVKGKTTDKIKSLSKGNQQKIQLIATLIHQPNLIILDEPFSGLDPVNVEIIKNVILQEKRRGATIIFSDHDMSNVEELCDDVVMINNGHLVLNGTVNEVRNNFGLTRLFIRTDLGLDEVKKLPGVENAILQNNGIYKLWLAAANYGQEIFKILSHGEYLQTFDQEPPTLDEIFKLKAGENNE
ncbi:ABC transporter ATP-binding protein [Lactobacillus paragasseri]|jgi:ABC-2 type transport system ATP-binding protein|uniref:ABC transporter ATP-binding protein n=1 Tax=Lactobacillus paragasseri TaxID=2107999 RepID=UPI0012E22B48|nr:ABC transporter ATP-binding protein [Lactobacillus paragasseri]MDK8086783.1 ABC transporter ATP-binding protein [Lactobacillus paragasseri]MDX5118683.1 ABC transporter ATP-binding protein [Lactobacillus paragasseri]MDX5122596.1 ABC transporter ATP-binding protein [Lactobacillus paragasseri]QGT98385.1 ABC transporter ATP-binding protein [Lactobacillus paragasseri]UWI47804.1 ABC transporter ATP-binding protein [Lactobacillus paragasseri]